jgi:acyl-coenzyme A synthetase/AMP-(fatty) acid ligase
MIFDKLLALPADAAPWIVDHEPIIVPAEDGTVAPSAVADAAARTATALRAGGVTEGTRCIVWLESPTDIIVAYAAVTALDAVPILISPTLSGPTLEAMVTGVSGITTMIATDERLTEARALLPGLAHLDWRVIAEELPASRPFSRRKEIATHGAYVVVHTSGTTGVPKLVECSAKSIRFNASVQAVIHWVSRLRGHLAFAISPVHGRTVVGILAALMRRAPLMLIEDHSTANVERMLKRHRPAYLETHPNTFREWQDLAPGGAFRSIRVFGAGFDVIHPDTVRECLTGSAHRFAVFIEVYGQNESGPVAIRCHVKGMPRLFRRRKAPALGGHGVGPRFAFCQVRILDDDGKPVPTGTPGRIVVRTPGTFSGYINRPELPSRNYPRGRWWDTGDWGTKSRLGYLTLLDRQVDRVAAAPSAIAIENVLLDQFPELLELVVIDVDGTALPVMSLRPGTAFRREAWEEAVDRVARLAEPVIIPDGEFPRTVTGKIQRAQLKDMIRRQHATVG